MPTNLEIIGINERSGLVTPNLYKQNWTTPNNTTDNYSVLHTRALSDATTPIYGKGTGIFLDTSNGGGDYDINGNVNYAGSGRLNAISINTASWSYGPATPYSVINTRALSDTTTPIYGKGTGLFLDTANGGGDYDINGNINYVGSGRLNAIGINTAQWSYGPATPYSVINTRALSDTTTPVYGKGTGLFLDTANGGGSYDINGNQTNFPGSGRVPLMNYNFAIWTFGPSNNYTMSHPHALHPNIIPTASSILGAGDVLGKGTNDGMGVDGTLVGHTNYVGGSWDDIISRDRNIQLYGNYFWVNVLNPLDTTNWYTTSHTRALSDSITPNNGKGTLSFTNLNTLNEFVLPAHTNYAGGSSDDIGARNSNILNPYNLYWVDSTSPSSNLTWYTLSHPNANKPTTIPNSSDLLISEGGFGDTKGKSTNSGNSLSIDGTLPAHIDYTGGNYDDIISRKRSMSSLYGNLYWVGTNEYTLSHPNSQAPTTIPNASDLLVSEGVLSGDTKGKGTNDPTTLNYAGEYVLAAHYNYGGGSNDDIISRKRSIYTFGNFYWVTGSEYNVLHLNAKGPTTLPALGDVLGGGDNKGKGTGDPAILNNANEFILAAHTNYAGGSWDDIVSRNNNIRHPNNLYWVDSTSPNSNTDWYTMSNANALAGADDKGKGTGDGMYIDGTYAAHMNYAGGSITDRNGNQTLYPGSGRIKSNSTNEATAPTTVTVSTTGLITVTGNKPFGYGFSASADYETNKPVCSDAGNTINVGSIKW